MRLPYDLLTKTLSSVFFIALNFGFSVNAQTTGYSGTGANIDVKYHRFEWTIDPSAGKNIAGTVTTYFETKQNNVSQITFDFSLNPFFKNPILV